MSQPLLLGPVTLDDGYLYEMDAIENWFKTNIPNWGDEQFFVDKGVNLNDNVFTCTFVDLIKNNRLINNADEVIEILQLKK